jgi:hypothetical protein
MINPSSEYNHLRHLNFRGEAHKLWVSMVNPSSKYDHRAWRHLGWSRRSTHRASTITRRRRPQSATLSSLDGQPTEQVQSPPRRPAGRTRGSVSMVNPPSKYDHSHRSTKSTRSRSLDGQPTEQVRSHRPNDRGRSDLESRWSTHRASTITVQAVFAASLLR